MQISCKYEVPARAFARAGYNPGASGTRHDRHRTFRTRRSEEHPDLSCPLFGSHGLADGAARLSRLRIIRYRRKVLEGFQRGDLRQRICWLHGVDRPRHRNRRLHGRRRRHHRRRVSRHREPARLDHQRQYQVCHAARRHPGPYRLLPGLLADPRSDVRLPHRGAQEKEKSRLHHRPFARRRARAHGYGRTRQSRRRRDPRQHRRLLHLRLPARRRQLVRSLCEGAALPHHQRRRPRARGSSGVSGYRHVGDTRYFGKPGIAPSRRGPNIFQKAWRTLWALLRTPEDVQAAQFRGPRYGGLSGEIDRPGRTRTSRKPASGARKRPIRKSLRRNRRRAGRTKRLPSARR